MVHQYKVRISNDETHYSLISQKQLNVGELILIVDDSVDSVGVGAEATLYRISDIVHSVTRFQTSLQPFGLSTIFIENI